MEFTSVWTKSARGVCLAKTYVSIAISKFNDEGGLVVAVLNKGLKHNLRFWWIHNWFDARSNPQNRGENEKFR